jgi:D-hexose-6-phosphate mutarotase
MTMNLEELNSRYALGHQLKFTQDANGLIVAEIENSLASARLALQGAHLLEWRPRSTSLPVVWYSPKAQLLEGKPPHSGAPVCWPWFGMHPGAPDFPAHGFARSQPWEVIATDNENGATRLTLRLLPHPETHLQWSHSSLLTLDVIVGETLHMTLTTTNTGDEAFEITEALHTYFQVADIAHVRVLGLEDCSYLDKVENFAKKEQVGSVTFSGETDRVYVDTAAECIIEDPGLRRRIRVAKSGSATTVVWTPWRDKAAGMSDVGEEWPHMVCVESANAAHNAVAIAPRSTHALVVEYSTEPL